MKKIEKKRKVWKSCQMIQVVAHQKLITNNFFFQICKKMTFWKIAKIKNDIMVSEIKFLINLIVWINNSKPLFNIVNMAYGGKVTIWLQFDPLVLMRYLNK